MFEENQELINEFVIESREGLAEVESDLLEIERRGEDIDVERVNKVFRAVHSIKGAAGFMGLATIGELSHSIENVLNMMRNRQLVPTSGRVNALLESCDVLKTLIEDIAHSEGVDVQENVAKLLRVASGEDIACHQPTQPVEEPAKPAAIELQHITAKIAAAELSRCAASELPLKLEDDLLAKSWKAGRYVYVMDFDLLRDKEFSGNIVELSSRLGDTGDLLGAYIDMNGIPGIDAPVPESLPCLVVLASVLTPDVFSRFWRLPEGSIYLLENDVQPGQFRRRTPMSAVVVANCPAPVTAQSQPTSEVVRPVVAAAPRPPVSAMAIAPVVTHHTPAPVAVASVAPTAPVAAPVAVAPAAQAHAAPVAVAKPAAPKAAAPSPATEPVKVESNIRVSVTILDRLMNLAGELVLSRNRLLQTISNHDERLLESVGARIDQVTTELQETIMATRMQPVGNVFNRFTRIVRDLSGMLGKQCQLVIEGNEVELDKTIIEAIGDPLTHLIRNSVDHGVELPAARESIGKPAQGTVHLRAYHQDGKVNISISDDGAGIDASKLRRKALEKGLITQEKADAMSDAEALRLIFLPGFSTAEQITAVSGRGVGMDVVKTNFEKLGGSVEIQTEIGAGTTMTVRLPLTLAIIPSLIVSALDQRFAVPQVNISELVRIRQGDETKRIERLRDAEVLRLRGSLLPLVRLSEVMRASGSEPTHQSDVPTSGGIEATNIIVLETGGLRYGLIVESLHDSEEIVVKPLGRHMADLRCFAGATVLGDGQIALILDITGLAANCGLENNERREKKAVEAESDENRETISTLLFTNHPSEQFGIPMSSVARIERIRADQIDAVAGQSVLQYRGGTLPLLHLEKTMSAKAPLEQSRLYVVVFRAGEREVGLVAPNIIDIRNISSNLDTRTFGGPGLLGSLIVDNKPTRVIDAYDIARHSHSEWFSPVVSAALSSSSTPHIAIAPVANSEIGTRTSPQSVAISITPSPTNARPKMLLAEDSAFFRNKVKQFIEQMGAEVVTAEDGAIAWSILQRGEHQFVGVVTDIEMPNMNGFELCERIRSSATHKHLPVVALTSLASDEHVRRGNQVGVNEYLIKLDRDKLVLALTAVLSTAASPSSQQLVGV